MAKRYDTCSLCGARALLNYALLCKRCNKSKESVKMKAEIFNLEHERIADAQAQEAEDEAAAEAEAAAGPAEGEAPAEGGDAPKGDAKPEEKSEKSD